MGKGTLMAVYAHPDDEALATGGTLARYAAEGHHVYVVTATRGEAGQNALPDLDSAAKLPAIRERELRCACQVLGVHPPHLLDYPDGRLAVAHQGEAVGKLVRLIRELRPQVLITFGPDGVYGHYDHIAVHRWTSIAYDLAADGGCFSELSGAGCRPHQVDKLYHHVLPEEGAQAIFGEAHPAVMMDGVPFAFHFVPAEEITTTIDISDFYAIKTRAVRCHVSQVGLDGGDEAANPDPAKHEWSRQESYVLARSQVGWPEGKEDDLFARVPL